MNLLELQAMKNVLKQFQCQFENLKPSCINCTKYDMQDKTCSEFKAQPPDDWVSGAISCESWVYDNVPF